MTPEQFAKWLDEMRAAKIATTVAGCARLLGVCKQTGYTMRDKGCDRRTALACRALLHRLEPYG